MCMVSEDKDIKIGKRIKEIRKQMGLTQEALSERVGISNTYLAMIEAGTRRGKYLIERIAQALNVDIEELEGTKPIPPRLRPKPLKGVLSEIESLVVACIPIYETIPKASTNDIVEPVDYFMPSRLTPVSSTMEAYDTSVFSLEGSLCDEFKESRTVVIDKSISPQEGDIIAAIDELGQYLRYYKESELGANPIVFSDGDRKVDGDKFYGVVVGIYYKCR